MAAATPRGTAQERRGAGLDQLITLARRTLLLKARDRVQLTVLLLRAPLFAALIGFVFGRTADRAVELMFKPAGTMPDADDAHGGDGGKWRLLDMTVDS